MKRIIALFCLFVCTTLTSLAQLPKELWEYAGTNIFMYLENDIKKNTHFHLQTDHHFLSFNYKDFKLEQLRLIDQKEIGKDYLDKIQETPFDILSLYVLHKGQKYKVVRMKSDLKYAGELIEGGQFYQRRNYPDLLLENGPEVKLSFEIASWTDALGFRLVFEEGTVNEEEYELLIELNLPKEQYSVKNKKGHFTAKAKNGKAWEIVSNENTDKIKVEKGVITAKAPISNKDVNLTMRIAQSVFHQDGFKITAKDLIRPNWAVKVNKSAEQQATIVSLNNSMKTVDGMERVALQLENTTNKPQVQRLIFEQLKGVRDITGISVLLRDKNGNPTGIPIQISKNWHNGKTFKYHGPWMRAYTIVCLPPNTKVDLEFSRVSGFWGKLPAVSHNQLSLTGWGKKLVGNHQLWEQTAMGAFGESICYEPDCGQANTLITDVRPFLIKTEEGSKVGPKKWSWTPNVGGGDFMRVYDEKGQKLKIKRIKTHYTRNCPNLTEVTYTGYTSKDEASYSLTSNIMRNDDYLRVIFTMEVEVHKTLDFERLALAQFGSETYSYSVERKIAWGNADGMINEMDNVHKEGQYTNQDIVIEGENPWFSMHQAKNMESKNYGVWGNKGVVLKEWSATVGGKKIKPHFSTFSSSKTRAREPVTLVEVNLPSKIKQLNKGDKIKMVIQLCIFPQEAKSYYGWNEPFRKALFAGEDTWKLMHREADQNRVKVEVEKGKLVRQYPLKIEAKDNEVVANINSGLAYVPITVSNLTNYKDFKITFKHEGKVIEFDQERFGNDYYQVDYNAETQTWEATFSVPTDKLLPN
ncbi:hypothetical protein [Flammeovirga sp. OC4]|uniref:hypothetical protein n=1 Tax=Flammeovirga sp. OC4 TaxID=1382345 RepID=UPI0005C55815|nr:hypothetical protein [Flammeovirga sp. OC4]